LFCSFYHSGYFKTSSSSTTTLYFTGLFAFYLSRYVASLNFLKVYRRDTKGGRFFVYRNLNNAYCLLNLLMKSALICQQVEVHSCLNVPQAFQLASSQDWCRKYRKFVKVQTIYQ
jgi:hypothetical protein